MWLAFALFHVAQGRPEPTVELLSSLATQKNISVLNGFVEGNLTPFNVLKGGAYDVGVYGWKAVEAKILGGVDRAVVFTTPLTGEDTGELLFVRSGPKLKFYPEDDSLGIKVGRHNISVRFAIPAKKAMFTDEVNFSKDAAASEWFVTRFSPCYKVTSLSNEGKAVPYVQLGGITFIKTPGSKSFKLKFEYSGTVNLPNYAASISDTNIQLTNDYWYPMVGRQPATADIHVESPADWTVVTMGNFVGTKRAGALKVTSYSLDIPVTYWSLTAAQMKYGGEMIDGLQLGMWSPRVAPEKMKLQGRLYAPIIKFYSQFAPFPFKSYGALDSPAYGGGAMEAYSFATYGGGVPSEDAHEPGHTWWGGLINNTYLKSFWNESFTVFSDGLYHRNVPIGSIADRAKAFSDVGTPNPQYYATSLADSGAEHGPVASTLGYGKGAHVMAMLEQLIGTQEIIRSMHEWIKVHPKGVPGNWEDYEKVVTGMYPDKNLKSFFDSWIRKPGAADVQLSEVSWKDGTLSGKLVWKGERYRMPLEVVAETAVGETSLLLDTQAVGDGGGYGLKLKQKPSRVALDPGHRAIRVGPAPTFDDLLAKSSRMRVYEDPKAPGALSFLKRVPGPMPTDLKGGCFLGHPATSPQVASLCKLAGFVVTGDELTYRGQKVNLKHGGAIALVSLPSGGEAMVGLGSALLRPDTGHARAVVFDDLGRFLAGETRLPGNTAWIKVP